MSKIKFDVTGSDPDKALRGGGASPKPGMYVAKLVINETFAKDPDRGGKPDKSRPQMEVVYTVEKADKKKNDIFKGSRLWSYIPYGENPAAETTQWKMDQLLQALGVASKKKRKGTFDPAKFKNTKVLIIVRPDQSSTSDDYRGKVAQVMAYDADTFKQSKAATDSDDVEEPDEEPDEDEDEDEDEESEEDDEDSDEDEEEEEEEDEDEEEEESDEDDEESDEDDEDDDEDEEEADDEEEEEEAPKPKRTRSKKSTAKAKSTAASKSRAKSGAGTKSGGKKSSAGKGKGKRGKKGDGFPF